ncbi:MAG: cytochrome c biogenesis protein ResB [Verrucomicrobiota bacterium]
MSQSTISAVERKKLIKERQQVSITWRWVHILGSLKFALLLLGIIAVACAFATFYESKYDTRMTQALIYKSPLFIFWLVFLCVNLICAAATRWPWQRKHTGFVITHAGIVILLIGSMIGMILGYDANVNLHKGQPPKQRLVLDEMVMLFEGADSKEIFSTPFEVRVIPPSEDRVRQLEVPEQEGLTLFVDRYSEKLIPVQKIVASEQAFASGIQLELFSGMMGQTLSIPLMSSPQESRVYDLFGLARIAWVEEFPKDKLPEGEVFRETHMVIASMPHQPIVHNTLGKSSGYTFFLEKGEDNQDLVLSYVDEFGDKHLHKLSEVLGNSIPAPEVRGEIQVMDFWPDFKMKDGKPITLSEEANNPALLLMVHGEFYEKKKPELLLRIDEVTGEVFFDLRREGFSQQAGIWKRGETKAMGWADWQGTLKGYYPKAVLVNELTEAASINQDTAEGIPGVRGWLENSNGEKSSKEWVVMGRPKRFFLSKQNALVGLSMRTKPIPFGIELVDFEVPRDPGTDTPANFISNVRFVDEKKNKTKQARIEMNHPASYPGGWIRLLTGVNYKFSQAGWNQENLDETTLQVLYDPGWFFKWTGSLMICVGIYMLFYMRSAKKRSVS